MTHVLMFSGSYFNNFPIRNLKLDTTIILDSLFKKENNKKFINEVMIRGLRLIESREPKTDSSENKTKNLKIVNMIIKEKNDSEDLEFGDTPILYYDKDNLNTITYICKHCKEECVRNSFSITDNMNEPHFCSNKCLMDFSETESDFLSNKIFEIDPKNKEKVEGSFGKKPKTFLYMKETEKDDKFQDAMRREAIRLEYAERREKYKKQMRQTSTRKSNTKNTSLKKELSRTMSSNLNCKARTKKGILCGNRVQHGSEYCGIASHQNQDPKFPSVKKSEEPKELKDSKEEVKVNETPKDLKKKPKQLKLKPKQKEVKI